MPEFSPEFWVGLAFAAIALLVGLAVAIIMVESTKGEFRFVVACFIVSSALTCYGIGEWEMFVNWPTRPRIFVGVLAFALVGVLTSEVIRCAHGLHIRSSGHAGTPDSGREDTPASELNSETHERKEPPQLPKR